MLVVVVVVLVLFVLVLVVVVLVLKQLYSSHFEFLFLSKWNYHNEVSTTL